MHRRILACGLILLAITPKVGGAQNRQGVNVVRAREIASVIPQLRRKISLKLEGTSIDAALQAVAKKAGLPLTYSDAILPARKVWLSAESIVGGRHRHFPEANGSG